MDELHICDECITVPMCIERSVVDLSNVCFTFKACMADYGHSLKHFEEIYVDVPGLGRQFRVRRASGAQLIVYDMYAEDVDTEALIIDRVAEVLRWR